MKFSEFERAAGRELSKKWKESIHVLPPSPLPPPPSLDQHNNTPLHTSSLNTSSSSLSSYKSSTLLSWLKERAAKDYGEEVVGRTIWVCWHVDSDYYQGTVTAYLQESGKHRVTYSPDLSEELHLPAEKLSFGPVKSRIMANDVSSPPLQGVTTPLSGCSGDGKGKAFCGQKQQQQQAVFPGVLLQTGNGTLLGRGEGGGGMKTMTLDDDGDNYNVRSNKLMPVNEERVTTGSISSQQTVRWTGSNRTMTTTTAITRKGRGDAGGSMAAPRDRVPKKSRSAPEHTLLAAVAAAAAASAAREQQQQQQLQQQMVLLEESRKKNAQMIPGMQVKEDVIIGDDAQAMSVWLHKLALDLDVELKEMEGEGKNREGGHVTTVLFIFIVCTVSSSRGTC